MTTTVEYLKWKNAFFKKVLSQMLKNEDYHDITYLVGNDTQWNQLHFDEYFDSNYERYYFDLLMIEFSDEEGYAREMFMPVPLLSKTTIKKIHKLLDIGALNIAHRAWHDKYKQPFPKIIDFYPPEDVDELSEDYDYND
jgi:hypothetical protein